MIHADGKTEGRYGLWAAALIASLLLSRLLVVWLYPNGLHGDEAQYWAWAQSPAFGYYSKPPLIAWVIWTSTALLGDAEWAVRLASPLFHTATATLTFFTARQLYGAKAGWLAAALYALMPGVALSASLISTDAALLFFVALFLFAWVRLRDDANWQWAALMGLALGLGLLSKYAMVYVLPAFAAALLTDEPTRRAVQRGRGALLAGLAGLLITPNLVWNASNGFVTFLHTGDNANLDSGPSFDLPELLEFVIGQLAVFGPLSFALLVFAIWKERRSLVSFGPFLAVLVLTPLLVISAQALVSRANANWAAAAYATAPVLLAGLAVHSKALKRWVCAALLINASLNLVPTGIALSPTLTDRTGLANSVKRQRGWPETVAVITQRFEEGDYSAVAVDNRLMFYTLTYYGMEETAPLRMWRYEPTPNSHAELTSALSREDGRVLLAAYYPLYDIYFRRDFETLEPLGREEIDLGGGMVREIQFYAASGYKGPVFRD